MITRRTTLKTIGGAAAAGAALSMSWVGRTWGQDEIPVGLLLDATGVMTRLGIPAIKGSQFAIEDINARGGVLGRKLKLISLDTQSDIKLYSEYTTRLILQDKVSVIMGGITSASREAVRPVIDKQRTTYWYNYEYEGGVCDKLAFVAGETPTQQMEPILRYFYKTHKTPKIYTLAADYNFGHISAAWLRWYLKGKYNAGTLVGEEFFPLDVTNFDTVLTRLETAKPDIIMSFLVGGNHIAFYRQYAARGLKEMAPIGTTTLGLGNEQVVLTPEEGEGITVCFAYFVELDTPANQEWKNRWQKRFGSLADLADGSLTYWTAWQLWALGVNKAGTLEPDPVIKALESGLTYDSPTGQVTLDPQTHHVVYTMHLAQINRARAFNVIENYPNVSPEDTAMYCDLIKKPDQHVQYTPQQ